MTISAQRFNFLDRETNVGIKEFTQLVDNSVYTGFTDITSSTLEEIQNSGIVNTLQENLDNLADMVQNDSVAETLKDTMDSVISTISNMELPETVKNVFESLKKLDFKGLKDFLKDMLKVGARFLCDNLDFLKLFMLGYTINKNILSGLLIACILSWLDRFCKGFTAEETYKATPLGKLGQMITNPGTIVNNSTAFNQFTSYYSDFLKTTAPIDFPSLMSESETMQNVLNGNIISIINNARDGEMSFAQRDSLIDYLQSYLSLYSPVSKEYRNILQAVGDLKNIPLISVTRRNNNLRYENLGDKFGSYIKNLGKVDLQPVDFMSLNDVQKGLHSKMEQLKKLAAMDPIIQSTPNDSFNNFNFKRVLPILSSKENDLLMSMTEITDSHRILDLHPTTTVFLEA